MVVNYTEQTKQLIDALKAFYFVEEFIVKILIQKNLGNDFKFVVVIAKAIAGADGYATRYNKKLAGTKNMECALVELPDKKYELLLMGLSPSAARLQKAHFLSRLAARQNEGDFHKLFDETLLDLGRFNEDVFSISTDGGAKVVLFDELSQFITDPGKRDNFCRSVINRLTEFSFEHIFKKKYDFFAIIFEYLIKDYNKDGGGKYAEYYTPYSVAKIMSAILVTGKQTNVKVYDPSAGSGTLLMSIAHTIGDERCTIYSEDISQKASGMLRLNLVLNNLVRSIPNIIQGNTILHPYHKDKNNNPQKFDYIVSNPPFKLDFSDWRETLADNPASMERFFAGIPAVPAREKDKMAIYLLFIQHIMWSLADNEKAVIVVPTGFITAQSGIEKKIRERLVEKKWLKGVVSMPSNIFATTGTNVSVLFLDKANKGKVVLVDASKLGEKVKDGKNQKTLLSKEDENKIISAFKTKKPVEDFSVVLNYNEIKAKNYSFSAGQYFDVKIEYVDITAKEFKQKMDGYKKTLAGYFKQGRKLETAIQKHLENLRYEK
jgi:type I restriction enzyme M protein